MLKDDPAFGKNGNECVSLFQERPFTMSGTTPSAGKTSAIATCPFCNAAVVIFLWAFAGNGKKKCPCGAVLYRRGVAKKLVLETPPPKEP